jgi:competence protein ComEA
MKIYHLITALLTALLIGAGQAVMAKDITDNFETEIVTVNVNQADAATIANTLVGVGYSRAMAIVEYREKHGPFYSAEELAAVKGVGQSTVEKNLARISLQ